MQVITERLFSEVPIVILDTETTGLNPGLGHRVVEIGAIRMEPGSEGTHSISGEFSKLIQPGRSMDPGASRVNGIYNEDLIGAPSFSDVAGELLSVLDGAVIVAHNARFDADFLGMELYIRSLTSGGTSDAVLPNPWLCTLMLARRHFHFGRNNLGHIARVFGIRTGRAHRALNDVYMTAEVMKRMVQEMADMHVHTVGDLLHAQGGAIYTPPPPQVFLPPPLDQAMAKNVPLRILYMSTSGETNRVVNPLYPVEHDGVPYLVAHCHLRQERRTFRLDRILSAELYSGPSPVSDLS